MIYYDNCSECGAEVANICRTCDGTAADLAAANAALAAERDRRVAVEEKRDAVRRGDAQSALLRRLPYPAAVEAAITRWRDDCECACAACVALDRALDASDTPPAADNDKE